MMDASVWTTTSNAMRTLREWLAGNVEIELAVPVGSRATGTAH